jgi:hypothetical protein
MSIEIKLQRVDRVYYPGVIRVPASVCLPVRAGDRPLQEIVKGVVEVNSSGTMVHNGIQLYVVSC